MNTGNDIYQVFTVNEENNQPVLRVSGEIYGAVTSKQTYHNYHLKLKDSGILYHAIGDQGQKYIRAYQPEYIMSAVADESQPFINGRNRRRY